MDNREVWVNAPCVRDLEKISAALHNQDISYDALVVVPSRVLE